MLEGLVGCAFFCRALARPPQQIRPGHKVLAAMRARYRPLVAGAALPELPDFRADRPLFTWYPMPQPGARIRAARNLAARWRRGVDDLRVGVGIAPRLADLGRVAFTGVYD